MVGTPYMRFDKACVCTHPRFPSINYLSIHLSIHICVYVCVYVCSQVCVGMCTCACSLLRQQRHMYMHTQTVTDQETHTQV